MISPSHISTLFPYTTLFRSDVIPLHRHRHYRPDRPNHGTAVAHRYLWKHFLVWGGNASREDRKSTRLNSSHANISYAVFCLKKKKKKKKKKTIYKMTNR